MITAAVLDYVAQRRAVGFVMKREAPLLKSFAAFADARGDRWVRSKTVLAWARQASSNHDRVRRLHIVIRFTRYAVATDGRHEMPPRDGFGRARPRRTPHLFSSAQIADVVAAASALGPQDTLRPKTYSTLFALLASTGLRVSEAIALQFSDVTRDGLIVRRTKFSKSRLVPLHPTASKALDQYLRARKRVHTADPHVFVTIHGGRIAYVTVAVTFLRILRALGIHGGRGTHRPGLHDLRHTFAVRSLEQCAMRQGDVARHGVALSTYLGHARVTDTYWYFQATPALLAGVATAAEAHRLGGKP